MIKIQNNYRDDLVHFGNMLHQRGLVAGTSGNLSVRLDRNRVLATPTNVCKGSMRPDDLVIVDLKGEHIYGHRKVSSEIGMHLAIYRLRPDVAAVVHAHPTAATAFAAAGLSLEEPLLAENIIGLGGVPLAPYATPGTPELAKSIELYIPGHKAILLANHGAVTYDATLQQAYWDMESLEQVAHITLITHLLGQQKLLSKNDVSKLRMHAAAGKLAATVFIDDEAPASKHRH